MPKHWLTIKKNIPVLKIKLEKDSDYYQGWVMLAKSYIITDNLLLSADSYEKAISIKNNDSLILEEYINILRRIDSKSNNHYIYYIPFILRNHI